MREISKANIKEYDYKASICIWCRIYKFFNTLRITNYPRLHFIYNRKKLSEIDQDKGVVLYKTILFSLGFSLVFITGVTASAVGNILLFLSNELRIAAGIIIILFSLQMLGILNFQFLNQEKRIDTKGTRIIIYFLLLLEQLLRLVGRHA